MSYLKGLSTSPTPYIVTEESNGRSGAQRGGWSSEKFRERARDLGEVFTPESTVNEMLDLLQDINYASKFLEPGCGSGNFLVEILSRKIEMVSRLPEVFTSLKTGRFSEFEFKLKIALASIYGIDIDPLNISEAKERLLGVFSEKSLGGVSPLHRFTS